MTPDRDEALLREALEQGLHPAGIDLWPAVAQALPAGQKRQARRSRALRLAICIGAPLLLAAGALLGRAQFTNLRTDPRPSFAPDKNTGYAIRYDQTAYALPDELMDSLMAHYNGQPDEDGVPPMSISTSGRKGFTSGGPGGRGYDSWAELTEATGLPLLQSDLLNSGTPDSNACYFYPNTSGEVPLPEDWSWDAKYIEKNNAYYQAYFDKLWRMAGRWPVGFAVSWDETSDALYEPQYLYPFRVDKLENGYTVETQAHVALATTDRPAGTSFTSHSVYFDKKAALTWEVEEYTTPSGLVALLPRCTSNGKSSPWLNSYAFLEQDGIFYSLTVSAPDGFGQVDDSGEESRAVLKEVLDSFVPAG